MKTFVLRFFSDIRPKMIAGYITDSQYLFSYNDYGDLCHILPPGLAPADYDADDPALLRIGYSYDAIGRPAATISGPVSRSFDYDLHGWLRRQSARWTERSAFLRHSCGDLQTMTYDGLGRKLGSEFTAARTGAKQHRRYYASGLVTCNDTVETIRFPGGYFAGPRFATCYYIKDYQGNNIAVVSSAAYAGRTQSTSYYPYGEPHRRPASSPGHSSDNRYLFGDKEYTDYGGESHHDFGARHLASSVIPHFITMDPHCENTPEQSPYVYCGGNPVMAIDPTGCDSIYIYEKDKFKAISYKNMRTVILSKAKLRNL